MSLSANLLEDLVQQLLPAVKQAGERILDFYQTDEAIKIEIKEDNSPVTQADFAAHNILDKAIKAVSDFPVVSEEGSAVSHKERRAWDTFWLVDPVDGTKEFIAGNPEFTVNVALIHEHQPVLGIIYHPCLKRCIYAVTGLGAWEMSEDNIPHQLASRNCNMHSVVVAISRRHTSPSVQDFLDSLESYDIVRSGSSWKLCLIARGVVDIYPRLAPTSEWDIAAGQCILEQAGGGVFNLQGEALSYNKRDTISNPHFYAVGDVSQTWVSYFKLQSEGELNG